MQEIKEISSFIHKVLNEILYPVVFSCTYGEYLQVLKYDDLSAILIAGREPDLA